jgi:hypothetical protein
MPDPRRSAPANAPIARHLIRGAIGFGLIGSAFALTSTAGPAALLLAAPGMLALRGCPTCWLVGLIQKISAGRLQRSCTDGRCTLETTDPRKEATDPSRVRGVAFAVHD